MELEGRVAVVTGGASGIGRALAQRFAREGAAAVVVADLDRARAEAAAAEIGDIAVGVAVDVTDEVRVRSLVDEAQRRFGRIDVFCSNAGGIGLAGIEASDATWQRLWQLHVMSHVYAARAVVPGMVERGEGYLVQTASAGGLLTTIGDAPYTTTKSAAIALAEWLSITYGDAGIRVSCLCPLGVNTELLREARSAARGDASPSPSDLEPDDVADAVIDAMRAERFLVLPQPEVAEFVRHKIEDRDHWLAAMRRILARATNGRSAPAR